MRPISVVVNVKPGPEEDSIRWYFCNFHCKVFLFGFLVIIVIFIVRILIVNQVQFFCLFWGEFLWFLWGVWHLGILWTFEEACLIIWSLQKISDSEVQQNDSCGRKWFLLATKCVGLCQTLVDKAWPSTPPSRLVQLSPSPLMQGRQGSGLEKPRKD